MSQRDVAEAAGITDQALSRIETGTRAPRVETLRALAAALGVPLSELLDEKAQRPPLRRRADIEKVAESSRRCVARISFASHNASSSCSSTNVEDAAEAPAYDSGNLTHVMPSSSRNERNSVMTGSLRSSGSPTIPTIRLSSYRFFR